MASRPRLYDRSLLSLLLQHRDDPLRRFIEERNGAESHRRAERSDKRQARAVYVVPFQRFHALRVLPTLGRSYLLCRAIRSRFTTRRYDVSGPFRRSLTCPDLSRSLLLLSASPAAAIPSSPSISTHAIPARSTVPRCKRAFIQISNCRTACRLIARASILSCVTVKRLRVGSRLATRPLIRGHRAPLYLEEKQPAAAGRY